MKGYLHFRVFRRIFLLLHKSQVTNDDWCLRTAPKEINEFKHVITDLV
jgi:hypothetical protein